MLFLFPVHSVWSGNEVIARVQYQPGSSLLGCVDMPPWGWECTSHETQSCKLENGRNVLSHAIPRLSHRLTLIPPWREPEKNEMSLNLTQKGCEISDQKWAIIFLGNVYHVTCFHPQQQALFKVGVPDKDWSSSSVRFHHALYSYCLPSS